ncbi:MAG: mannose-1-phosphate guanylyltransferase [Acidobacteria bacterium]|nr:mannose-1-phosphate guanylyltransferase [Acidobacteriota bacterium]
MVVRDDHARVLVLAGGSGTRLWPLSTDARPKPFLPLASDHTLLEDTFARARRVVEAEHVYFSARDTHAPLLRKTLPAVPEENLILEPERRNTAPAIGLSAAVIGAHDPGAVLAVLPSDQAVKDEEAFTAGLRFAVEAALAEEAFVTLGILPTRPETGYGYLETAEGEGGPVRKVVRFVEKPTREKAEEFLSSGCFLWNAGIFVFRVSVLFAEMERQCPDILHAVQEAARERRKGNMEGFRSAFALARKISIDYAVMENARAVRTVPCSCGWSDLGAWDAVWEYRAGSGASNVLRGQAEIGGGERSLVFASGRPVKVLGLDDVIVVDSEDGVLVTRRDASDLLRESVEADMKRRAG